MTDRVVSIITPSYNQGRYIEECIRSVRDQDYPHIEHLIIDGGSTDETLNIIRKYEDALAYWVSEKDEGISDAINKGLQKATGEMLWFVSADDTLVVPGAISALVSYLEDHPDVAFVYGDLYLVDKHGQVRDQKKFPEYDLFKLVFERVRYPVTGCLMRRSLLSTVGFLDPSLRGANDLDYFFRIALRHKMGHVAQFTSLFRIHSDQMNQAGVLLWAEESIRVYERLLQSPDAPPELLQRAREVRAEAFVKAARSCFSGGRASQARAYVLLAFRHSPRLVLDLRLFVTFFLTFLGDAAMARVRSLFRRFFRPRYE